MHVALVSHACCETSVLLWLRCTVVITGAVSRMKLEGTEQRERRGWSARLEGDVHVARGRATLCTLSRPLVLSETPLSSVGFLHSYNVSQLSATVGILQYPVPSCLCCVEDWMEVCSTN